jgi:hypothetical protein
MYRGKRGRASAFTREQVYEGSFLHINPAGEPKNRGGPACLAPVKQGFLHEAFTAQGFGQVSSPVLWLLRQFTLLCSTSLYIATNVVVLPEMEGSGKKPADAMQTSVTLPVVNADALSVEQQFQIQKK